MPSLSRAFEDCLGANPRRKPRTMEMYRTNLRVCFGDWLSRSLDAIDRGDVEARFHQITERRGWATANQAVSMLRSIYRRSSIDHEGLRNPVELWIAGGGRLNRKRRRRISSPAEVLPRWRAGVDAAGLPPAHRDIFTIGAYTGMRQGEVVSLRWERIDLERGVLRVEETKTGEPLELPLTRQLAAVLECRRAEAGGRDEGWVFPSSVSVTGHLKNLHRYHAGIGEAGGARFWYHGLRNAFITVAERDLMPPRPLTKRLVNHARDDDITEGYAADWTVEQLREPAQRVADRKRDCARAGQPSVGRSPTRGGLTAVSSAPSTLHCPQSFTYRDDLETQRGVPASSAPTRSLPGNGQARWRPPVAHRARVVWGKRRGASFPMRPRTRIWMMNGRTLTQSAEAWRLHR